MTQGRKTLWLNNALLLGALAAGTFTAQLMPAYHEHVGKITYPSAARAASSQDESRGYSRTDSETPDVALVRTSS